MQGYVGLRLRNLSELLLVALHGRIVLAHHVSLFRCDIPMQGDHATVRENLEPGSLDLPAKVNVIGHGLFQDRLEVWFFEMLEYFRLNHHAAGPETAALKHIAERPIP